MRDRGNVDAVGREMAGTMRVWSQLGEFQGPAKDRAPALSKASDSVEVYRPKEQRGNPRKRGARPPPSSEISEKPGHRQNRCRSLKKEKEVEAEK